jgi:HAD superfamily hydrolase (TIGR01509 family)
MRLPRAVIFDFDGVIVDTEPVKFKRLNNLLKPYGLKLRGKDYDSMVGRKTAPFLKQLFKRLGEADIQSIERARHGDQLRNLRLYARPVKGVAAFVRLLHRRGVRLAVATGTRRKAVDGILGMLGIRKFFSVLVTGEEFRSSKPDPEVYRLALRKLRLPRKDVLVIEDAPAGIAAAKRAGLRCVAITTTEKRGALRRADVVVDSFARLEKRLA